MDPASGAAGTFGSSWTAYSAAAGVLAKVRLGDGFSIEPAIDVGLARLQNRTSYSGGAASLQPVLDGVLFNWDANARLVTPSVALEWSGRVGEGATRIRGHFARSWITSFDETDPVQPVSETANIYSIRTEYVHPTAWKAFERTVSTVAHAGYAGFFGPNRNVLGFDGVGEFSGGLEVPLIGGQPGAERLRLSAAYLFGSGVRGWAVGLGMQY